MNLHLAEIAAQIAPGAHAALSRRVRPAGICRAIVMPPNITLIPLPGESMSRFLNPQENVWQFLRDNWLSKPNLQILRRASSTIDACEAWNNIVDQSWRIAMSIGLSAIGPRMGPDQRVLV